MTEELQTFQQFLAELAKTAKEEDKHHFSALCVREDGRGTEHRLASQYEFKGGVWVQTHDWKGEIPA